MSADGAKDSYFHKFFVIETAFLKAPNTFNQTISINLGDCNVLEKYAFSEAAEKE